MDQFCREGLVKMYRVEDKYVIPENDYYELRERISSILPADSNAGSGKDYLISSLYFDDIYDTDYFDTVSGNPYRRKHRIRIYNDSLDMIKLEVKRKNYNRIDKVSCSITKDELSFLMNGKMIRWGNSRDDPRTLFNEAVAERCLAPRVIVTYRREAFVYAPGNLRITFDRNVRASDNISLFGSKNITYDYPEDTNYVLEVKYDEFIPNFILQVLEIDSMQQTAFSKYGNCRSIYMGDR